MADTIFYFSAILQRNAGHRYIIIFHIMHFSVTVGWSRGLRRWFQAPVSWEAWVRISPLPHFERTLIRMIAYFSFYNRI